MDGIFRSMRTARKIWMCRLLDAVTRLYDRIVDDGMLIRRVNLSANRVTDESQAGKKMEFEMDRLSARNGRRESDQRMGTPGYVGYQENMERTRS